jgi:hypothetical protein
LTRHSTPRAQVTELYDLAQKWAGKLARSDQALIARMHAAQAVHSGAPARQQAGSSGGSSSGEAAAA